MNPALRVFLLLSGLFALALFTALPPYNLMGKANFVASGVCHRLPEHSLFFDGEQSPLCARCTGTYLGLLLATALLILRGKLKSGLFPPLKVSLTLATFVALWGVDGFNSFWDFWKGSPLLYAPSNGLRLVTGLLYGLSWGGWFIPFFNSITFKNPTPRRSLENFWELALLVTVGMGSVALIETKSPFLLYPLTFLSFVGPLLLLGAINAMLLKLALNLYPEGIEKGGEFLPLFSAGISASLVEITVLNLVRAALRL